MSQGYGVVSCQGAVELIKIRKWTLFKLNESKIELNPDPNLELKSAPKSRLPPDVGESP